MIEKGQTFRGLRISFWALAIALGAADAWTFRFSMNPDGISYLDIGDAYWRGDWHMAINAYWSPLYSWILGFFLKVLKPSPYWEYPLVHLVNFLIYLAALGCFDFFLSAFIRFQRASGDGEGEDGETTLPEWAWWALGYSLFTWTSLELITIKLVSPDMCVAGFVYLASGVVLRIRLGIATQRTFALLGVVLGFGYLAKSIMFPLAFIFLAVALFVMGNIRIAAPRVVMAALVFFIIASPFIASISFATGRFTFGNSGKMAYEAFANKVDFWFPSNRSARHPPRKVVDMPLTYEFREPIGGTYPPWYDPAYWHEGIEPEIDLAGEGRVLVFALMIYGWLLFNIFQQFNVTAGLTALYFLMARPSQSLRITAANWPFLIPAASAIGAYAIVYTEFRYIAAFVALLWLAAFSGVRLSGSLASRKLKSGLIVAVVSTNCISATGYTLHNLTDATNAIPSYWQAANSLADYGVKPNDKMGLIWNERWGKDALVGTFIARLAKVQIVAEVPRSDTFWAATPLAQSQVIQTISRAGAKSILTTGEPHNSIPGVRWKRLGPTNFYVCFPRLDPE
jgi:hypothetical protein